MAQTAMPQSRRRDKAAPAGVSVLTNPGVWQQEDVVAEYAAADELQPPEAAILAELRARPPLARLLDIGVGAGRTMRHFAPLARRYWGIDYSAPMIAAALARRPAALRNISLAVCDARAMTLFPDRAFDFVLFSYNGIDYVAHADRLRVFAEVTRVAKPGGWFFFSSHNLQCLSHAAPRSAPYRMVDDGVHQNRLLTYYIKPAAQLRQLAPFFESVAVLRLNHGQVVQERAELESITDPWLYYLCAIPQRQEVPLTEYEVEKLSVPCPCNHPSHPAPCGKPMIAGEEKCPDCQDHVEGAGVP